MYEDYTSRCLEKRVRILGPLDRPIERARRLFARPDLRATCEAHSAGQCGTITHMS